MEGRFTGDARGDQLRRGRRQLLQDEARASPIGPTRPAFLHRTFAAGTGGQSPHHDSVQRRDHNDHGPHPQLARRRPDQHWSDPHSGVEQCPPESRPAAGAGHQVGQPASRLRGQLSFIHRRIELLSGPPQRALNGRRAGGIGARGPSGFVQGADDTAAAIGAEPAIVDNSFRRGTRDRHAAAA